MFRRYFGSVWFWAIVCTTSAVSIAFDIGGQIASAKNRGSVVNVPLVQPDRCLARNTKLLPKGEHFWGMEASIVTMDVHKDGAGRRTFRGYSWQMDLLRCVQEQ